MKKDSCGKRQYAAGIRYSGDDLSYRVCLGCVRLSDLCNNYEDRFIDYSRRVARICKNYKSYIQCIGNDFVTDGYLVLRIGEFSEMLEIRDTVQKPVLMYENADKNCTRFFIAADGIVYLHEIQVEKFEELNTDAGNHTVTESFAENAESSDASESKLCSHTKTLAKRKTADKRV